MAIEIDLRGHRAIVTGAGRGIGERIATRLAEAGADVVAVARTESEIEDTVERIESHGVEGLAVPTDLSNAEEIDALIDTVLDEWGTPDILINNAGANLAAPPLGQTVDEIDTMLTVNVRGLFLLSQRFARELRRSDLDRGRIVNISSVVSRLGVSQMTVYGGTNAAVNAMTRGLAAELAEDGTTVNAVLPGLIRVDRIGDLLDERGDQIYDLDRIPLGDLGTPTDIANACLFLASDLAGYVTGAELTVDGGIAFTAGLYR